MSAMRLRSKIILLGVLPLVASFALIALAVWHQQGALAAREHELVEREYMHARRTELRHYVELAVSTVAPLYAKGSDNPADRQAALQQMGALDYGSDGYFFVYDLQGQVLMHSRQPELVGQNLWELRDPQGQPTIQLLIAQARGGGGYLAYPWRKPSTGQMAPKLGYVVALERWQWMVGTGLYLDDIEAVVAQMDRQASSNIAATLLWMAGIAALGVALIAGSGAALNLSEHRVADSKLRLLAQQVVQSQEDERARLARELHDGVSQTLVSTKLLMEAASASLQPAHQPTPQPAIGLLAKALQGLNAGLNEVRTLSHRLRPSLLDTLGLAAALQHLGREAEDAGLAQVQVAVQGPAAELPDLVKTALFRVAQECLTNIAKHAHAHHVQITLQFAPGGTVRMRVDDDGQGFDVPAVRMDPRRGIGLRNMRERMAAVGGELVVRSIPGAGTTIEAVMPPATMPAVNAV